MPDASDNDTEENDYMDDANHSSHSEITNWGWATTKYKKKYSHSIIANLAYLGLGVQV